MSMPVLLGVRTELAPPLPAVRAEEREVTETCGRWDELETVGSTAADALPDESVMGLLS